MEKEKLSEHCLIHRIDTRYKKCPRQQIHVIIVVDDAEIPLCREHWFIVADSNRSWGNR